MKKLMLRAGVLVAAVVVLVPLLYVMFVLARSRGGLPEWDGALSLRGLDAPVEVLRDENAVPHIFAASERDAFFAQGFVHAQDRLWQMMSSRQLLAGRMSEWFGGSSLGSDRFNRISRPPAAARRDFERLSSGERALLEAYAAGVNAYLASDVYRRPPEMVLLHVEPEPWAAHDSLVVYGGTYNTLLNYGSESLAQRLRLHASHPRAEALSGLQPYEVRPIVETATVAGAPVEPVKSKSFSDSWVLSGAHTRSGKPLLANDPQLASTLPSFWYLNHLSIAGDDRVGASLPGIPGIALGRTDRVAWGITAGRVDQADIALVHGDPADPTRFRRRADHEWQSLRPRDEVFQVRFSGERKERLYETPEGVIVPNDLATPPLSNAADARIELKIVHFDGDTSLSALFGLNRAKSVAEAYDALSSFTGPSLNFTLADVDGQIGYVSAGRHVRRQGDAARVIDFGPVDGSSWSTTPYGDNPHVLEPSDGRIVSANQQAAGDDHPYYLSDSWGAPHRAMRIHALLDARPKHDVESFVAMQRDTFSEPARRVVPKMLEVAKENLTEVERSMLDVLGAWDFRFENDSAAPTVFVTWLRYFHEALAADEVGPAVWPRMVSAPLPAIALTVLAGQRTDWCARVGDDAPADCQAVLRRSLAKAADALQARFGRRSEGWQWGDVTPMEHPHLGFSGFPVLGPWFSRTATYPGGPDTLMIKHVDVSNAPDFSRARFVSSLQIVFDLADLDASRFMLSTGQSGHYRSPHYDDFLPRFVAQERFTIPTERNAIAAAHRLELSPAP